MKKNTLFTKTALLAVMVLTTVIGASQAETVITPENMFDVSTIHDLYIVMAPDPNTGDPADAYEAMRLSSGDNNGETPGAGTVYPDPITGEHFYWQAYMADNPSMIDTKAVAIRRKSDLSLPDEINPEKFSLKIDISKPGFTPQGQRFGGKKKLSLECGSDAAIVTEGLSWNIYNAMGMISGRANWLRVHISLDGGGSFSPMGLFANVEQVDEEYLEDHVEGRNDYGFLYKDHETLGEIKKTRELETNPFEFSWWPFNHPNYMIEDPTPADWMAQAETRVNMEQLITAAVGENFIGNTDGMLGKNSNMYYYDYANGPDPNIMDPAYQQPRLYIPWDLDTVLKNSEVTKGIDEISIQGRGDMAEGLFDEVDSSGTPWGYDAYKKAYYAEYDRQLVGALDVTALNSLIDTIETSIAAAVDADTYSEVTSTVEFPRLRTFMADRIANVDAELDLVLTSILTTNVTGSGSVTVEDNRTRFADNETVELTAVNGSGVFVRWEGDASGSANPLSLPMDASKNVTAVFAVPGTDVTPPTPAPTFATAPFATGSTSIAMISTIAVDPNGVEYYFTCTAGGGNDSGWISENSYEDTGLAVNTSYSYSVKARDLSVNFNETAQSASSAATTLIGSSSSAFDVANADFETALGSISSGSYTDTQASEDISEAITEETTGGAPNSRSSSLEHKWTFNVTGGDTVTFYLEAYQTSSSDGDNFTFAYSTDDSSYTDMVTVTKTADDNVAQSYTLAAPVSGTVYVRVVDTDRNTGSGQNSADTIYIDDMFFSSASTNVMPSADVVISPADAAIDVLLDAIISWTPGADATSTHVYLGTDATPDAGDFQADVAGSTFDPELDETTTYYLRLDAVNAAGVTAGAVTSFTTETLPVAVPDVTGQVQATAEGNITAAGLVVGVVTTAYSDTVAAGNVISQNPVGGGSVPPATPVDLVVSLGLPVIPDVTGQAQAAAEANIVAATFTVGTVTTAYSDTVAAGDVISQSLVGPAVSGTAIDLVVSDGLPVIPDVTGQAQATAEANIVAATFTVGTVTTAYSDTVAAGDVISQSLVGPAVSGTAVDLVVSDGLPVIPDVTGQAQATAEANIVAATFTVGTVTTAYSDTVAAGNVISQGLVGPAVSGTAVDLVVSDGLPVIPDVTGQAQAAAEANIVAATFTVGTVTTAYSDTVAAGNVISQGLVGPAVSGTAVDLVVSDGLPVIPDVTGQAQAAAEANIVAATFTVGTVTTAYSDTVAAGNVISQGLVGPAVSGTAVDLVVSDGLPVIPDVTGQAQAAAEANIVAATFTVGTVTTAYSDTVAAGNVISQGLVGPAVSGTAVDLVVSDGLPVIPDVTGQAQATAEANIVAATFTVGTVTTAYSDTVAAGDVISQSLVGPAVSGTAVDLVVSDGLPVIPDVTGQAQATAEANIVAATFTVGTVTTAYSDTVAAGNVISQGLVGPAVSGTAVDLVVSDGLPVIPDVTGQAQAAAEANIVAATFTVGTVTTAYSDTVAAGNVISQGLVGPAVSGTAVDLVVSDGLPVIPDVTGQAQAAAEANIVAATFTVGTVTTAYSDTVAAGNVISQGLVGPAVSGTAVDLVVSDGLPVIPDVTGQAQAAAEANIVAATFTVGTVTTAYSDTVAAGNVISQGAVGPATSGTAVDLVVSDGLPVIPDVTGQAQATAEANIVAATFTVGTVTTAYSDTVAAGDVISQSLVGPAVSGTAVDLVVSDGLPVIPDVTGQAQAAAEANIVAATFTVGTVTTAYSDTVAAGNVISQGLVGPAVSGTAVDLVVSDGLPVIPDVTGQAQAAAEANIVAATFTVGTVTTAYSDTVAAGNVISQGAVGPATSGTAVDLVVSDGLPVIPDVTGQAQAAAEANIVAATFTVGTVTTAYSDTVAAGNVISQGLVGPAVSGTAVDLVVSDGLPVIPDVTGQAQAAAEANIVAATFTVGTVTTAYSDTVAAGNVISQGLVGPAVSGTAVDLVVSDGLPVIPDVTGQAQAAAEANIVAATFTVGTVTTAYSDTVAAGNVISQGLVGPAVSGTAVDLVVSDGLPVIPDVTGQAQAAAEANIVAATFTVGTVTTAYSDTVAAGNVISQGLVGPAVSGTAVDLVVSDGLPVIPDVTGQAQAAAEANIVAATFTVGTVTTAYSDTVAAGDVISQGAVGPATSGTAVDLVVSDGPAPPSLTDDFSDNLLGSAMWQLIVDDPTYMSLEEISQRLEILATGGLPSLLPSCVGLWAMNDNAADTMVIDSSGNGNDGTAQQNTQILNTAGKIDGALTFNGTSDYVDVGVAVTGAYTKVAWIKRSAAAGNFYGNIMSSDTQSHFFWTPYHQSYKLTAGHNSTYYVVQDSVPIPADGNYYFVAVTFDPAVDSGTMVLYKNGVSVDSATGVVTQSASNTTYLSRFLTGYGFAGSIDDAMLFDRALSTDEIAFLYNGGVGTETIPDGNEAHGADYSSKTWTLDAGSDFEVQVDFHYSNLSQQDGWAGISIEKGGVYAGLTAGSDGGAAYYYAETDSAFEQISRASDDGTLYVSYDSALDELYLSYTGHGASNAWQTLSGLLQSSGSVSVAIGGGSNNVQLVSGEAYLDNFEVTAGTLLDWPAAADINLDGFIDLNDLLILCGNWLTSGPAGDITGNGFVDLEDFAEFSQVW